MKERPILFNGEMVRAILDGRKTQTRRVIKNWLSFSAENDGNGWEFMADDGEFYKVTKLCPFGKPGDRLWVREAFQPVWSGDEPGDMDTGEGLRINYKATDEIEEIFDESKENQVNEGVGYFCNPSIHMPRWASRINLEVTNVRVERVQDISIGDAVKEGVESAETSFNCFGDDQRIAGDILDRTKGSAPFTFSFAVLWDSIAKPGFTWTDNPWVWVVEFKEKK